jgi:hypothetical protein
VFFGPITGNAGHITGKDELQLEAWHPSGDPIRNDLD